jgi:hypothetical protein
MAAPIAIRIPYEDFEYARFSLIGRTARGQQFMGFVTGAMPSDWWSGKHHPLYIEANWARFKRWYAVMHLFDLEGNHLTTDARSGGNSISTEVQGESCRRADEYLEQMFRTLGAVQFCGINIKTFGVEIDGYFFGLVYEVKSYDDPGNPDSTYESLMLQPNDIMFHPPWDSGEYST